MSIFLVGLNHKTAPIEVRERLAFTEESCSEGLRSFVDGQVVQEGLIVSTCNRVEVISSLNGVELEEGLDRVARFLSDSRGIPRHDFDGHLYHHSDRGAVRHLFRVASSLDSMVVGEPQVLGQVRRAYSLARTAGTAGRVLNRLVHQALHVAKRVRTETGIAASAVSISYMAVELGRKIFDSLSHQTVLVVGAGEMAELTARHLRNAGVAKILVTNRTSAAARDLADEIDATAVDFAQIGTHLSEADIVICSTGADSFVITPQMARAALEGRRNRPSFYIDISVPRNIDPGVGEIPNLFLFDIDDLQAVVASNMREREREAERAELIVDAEVERFQESLRHLDMGPSLGALKNRLDDIAKVEYARQRSRLGNLTSDQEKAVEKLLASTVNKIAHPILSRMRQSMHSGDEESLNAWRELFGLDDENDPGISSDDEFEV